MAQIVGTTCTHGRPGDSSNSWPVLVCVGIWKANQQMERLSVSLSFPVSRSFILSLSLIFSLSLSLSLCCLALQSHC